MTFCNESIFNFLVSIATKPLPTGTPSGWTCDVCLVPNKGSDNVCVACQSEKPGMSVYISRDKF